jgi:hypothetical protein
MSTINIYSDFASEEPSRSLKNFYHDSRAPPIIQVGNFPNALSCIAAHLIRNLQNGTKYVLGAPENLCSKTELQFEPLTDKVI